MILSADKVSGNMVLLLDREGGTGPADTPSRPFEDRPSLNNNGPANPKYHRYFHPSSKYFEDIRPPSKIALSCEGYTRWNSSPGWNRGSVGARSHRQPLHDPDRPSAP